MAERGNVRARGHATSARARRPYPAAEVGRKSGVRVCVWPASKGMPGGAARAGRVGERSEDAAGLDAQTRAAGKAGQPLGGRAVGGGAGTFCDGSRAARSRARATAGRAISGAVRTGRKAAQGVMGARSAHRTRIVRRAAGTAGFIIDEGGRLRMGPTV